MKGKPVVKEHHREGHTTGPREADRDASSILRSWPLLALSAIVLGVVLFLWGRPLAKLLADVEQVRRFVASFGIWAPSAIIGLEVAQVVLAPIPGGAIDLTSGYLFGAGWGTLYSMAGVMGGTITALYLARRFGRPLVERLVPRHTLSRLDHYARHRGELFFLLLFLMPFTPNDVACFLAGLTPIPLVRLILIALIGRIPGVLMANLMGASAMALSTRQWLLIGVPLSLIALGFWRYQERIEESLLRLLTRLYELLHR